MNFHFEGGVKSFVRYLNKNRLVMHEPMHIDMEVETTQVEAAIQYTDAFTESVFAFANTINTPDGGSHLTGLRTAVTRMVNDYARQQGLDQGKAKTTSPAMIRARVLTAYCQRQGGQPAI